MSLISRKMNSSSSLEQNGNDAVRVFNKEIVQSDLWPQIRKCDDTFVDLLNIERKKKIFE
jgi:hypothetical protein